MIKEFWSESVTNASWKKLIELSKKYDFVLIGGWAAYLWTDTHKSKDIDIVVDYDTLYTLKADFELEKNERLKKYEIKMGEFDVDVYLGGYSDLSFPLEKLSGYTQNVKGIKVPSAEVLVILKQGAAINRKGSIKGRKDLIDIITLLLHSGFSIKKYKEILTAFSLINLEQELIEEIKEFNPKDVDYLGIDFNQYAKWKKQYLKKLKE
jgi:effector-binding domain-containing protein